MSVSDPGTEGGALRAPGYSRTPSLGPAPPSDEDSLQAPGPSPIHFPPVFHTAHRWQELSSVGLLTAFAH